MKKISYTFSKGDVDALTCTLSLLPLVEFDEIPEYQQKINDTCCLSAIQKLKTHQNFEPNELKVIALSLIVADLILKNQLEVDISLKNQYAPYLFSINHLLPVFRSVFD